jgi:carbon monoxide dehydrogenase subunit G
MKLEQSFEVAAPIVRVWDALIDVERVAPSLPGAAITGRNDDGSYSGTFTIKIGPTTAAYTGKLEMENVDEATHTATMQAQGTDKRGQGGAKATIVSKLSPAGEGATRVEVDTDYHITGRLARFGRGGMIEDISERLLREFASRLQASLTEEPAPVEPVASEALAGQPTAAERPPTEAAAEPRPMEGAAKRHPTEAAAAPSDAPSPPPVYRPPASPAPPNEPIQGLSLAGSVMVDRARRNLGPLLAALGFLLFLRFLRRGR